MVGNRRSSKFFSAGNFPVLCFSQKITTLRQKENRGAIACFVQKQREEKKKRRSDGWMDGCSVEKTFLCITIAAPFQFCTFQPEEKHSGDDCGQEWPRLKLVSTMRA